MMWRRAATLLAAMAVLAACESSVAVEVLLENGETIPAVPDGATAVAFGEVEEASTSVSAIMDRERLVITDATAWEAYWARFSGSVAPMPPVPAVDFATERVVTAAMGTQPTGGYSINVPSVQGDGQGIYVVVRETSPGPGCIVTQALTAPAVAVTVPADERPVLFVEESVVVDCS